MTEAPANWLLSVKLRDLVERLGRTEDESEKETLYAEADRALADAGAEEEADLALPVWERDLEALRALIEAWDVDTLLLPAWDKAVLKRAFKAYKKRLKLVRLDDESTSGANPLSQGRSSSIMGVRPPETYPPEVWELLVKQGKLRDGGSGLLELATI